MEIGDVVHYVIPNRSFVTCAPGIVLRFKTDEHDLQRADLFLSILGDGPEERMDIQFLKNLMMEEKMMVPGTFHLKEKCKNPNKGV